MFNRWALIALAVALLVGCAGTGVASVPVTELPLTTPTPTAVTPAVPRIPSATAAPTRSAPAVSARPPYDWPQFNFNAQHSGDNTLETTITPGNVGNLRRLFQISLPAIADGAPVYQSAVNTPTGVRDLVFVTTKAGHIVALDAHTGAQVWVHQYPAGSCRTNNGFSPRYTTSSPALDPTRQYVYSYGLDGFVHKYRVSDGVEITGGGWPELATLKPYNEKGSSALGIATAKSGASYLYVTNGGYLGDRGDYQGHITAIKLNDGTQHVFNANCSDQAVHFVEQPGLPDCSQVQSAIWARPGAVYDPDTDKICMSTGNGTFDPAHHDWGDTVFVLNPDGTGAKGSPLDSYTPANFQELQDRDADLGSTAPVLVPVPASSTIKHLALQGGKDGELRLLNLDNLSGQGGPGHTAGEVGQVINVPQGGAVFTTPAVWVNPVDGSTWVYVSTFDGISGFRLAMAASGTPGLELVWTSADGGTSPIIADNVLYYAGDSGIFM
jgi:hypothetical protein